MEHVEMQKCPLCISPLHPDATVCAACGAVKKTENTLRSAVVGYAFVATLMICIIVFLGFAFDMAVQFLDGKYKSMLASGGYSLAAIGVAGAAGWLYTLLQPLVGKDKEVWRKYR